MLCNKHSANYNGIVISWNFFFYQNTNKKYINSFIDLKNNNNIFSFMVPIGSE